MSRAFWFNCSIRNHMNTLDKKLIKRTYTLPAETLAKFEEVVPSGKRGAALNEAIDHWLEEKRRTEIRTAIDASFDDAENMKLYEQVESEGRLSADEVWSRIDDDWSQLSAEELDREFRCG